MTNIMVAAHQLSRTLTKVCIVFHYDIRMARNKSGRLAISKREGIKLEAIAVKACSWIFCQPSLYRSLKFKTNFTSVKILLSISFKTWFLCNDIFITIIFIKTNYYSSKMIVFSLGKIYYYFDQSCRVESCSILCS